MTQIDLTIEGTPQFPVSPGATLADIQAAVLFFSEAVKFFNGKATALTIHSEAINRLRQDM